MDDNVPYNPRIKLLPGERLVTIEPHPFSRPSRAPSPVEELCKLTGVDRLEDVGTRGPSMASRASKENAADPARRQFEVLFGRDSLIVAGFVGPHLPVPDSSREGAVHGVRIWADRLTDITVLILAGLQGLPKDQAPHSEQYEARRELPGRIVHEVRDPSVDPIAQQLTREEGWGWPMYGSDDASVLFALAVLRMAEGDPAALDLPVRQRDGVTRSLGEIQSSTLRFIERRLGREGLFETHQAGGRFIDGRWQGFGAYQGWADSWDHLSDRDGRLPTGPVALVEIQALAYDVFCQTGRFLVRHPERADQLGFNVVTLANHAAKLRGATLEHLLVADERGTFFGPGAERMPEGMLHALATRTSNMGHLLDSELLSDEPDLVHGLIDQLFDPAKGLMSPFGVRTLESGAVRFRPGGYHTGQVWLWDNLKIARGLDRNGYHGLAWELKARVAAVCNEFNLLPEAIRGGDEATPQVNQRVVDVLAIGPDGQPKMNRVEQPPQDILAMLVAGMVEVNAQLAALAAGTLPAAAIDPLERAFESTMLEKVGRSQQLVFTPTWPARLRP